MQFARHLREGIRRGRIALMRLARHGSGDQLYLIRFHYLPPGGWDT